MRCVWYKYAVGLDWNEVDGLLNLAIGREDSNKFGEEIQPAVVVGGSSLIPLKLGVGLSYSGELIIGDDGRVPFPSHGSRQVA